MQQRRLATFYASEPAGAALLAAAPQAVQARDLTAREADLLRQAVGLVLQRSVAMEPLSAEPQAPEQGPHTTAASPPVDPPTDAASPAPASRSSDGLGAPADRTLDDVRSAIQSGYPVFARPVDPAKDFDLGQFVGVVDGVIESRGTPYLHVRGALEQARELFLPLGAVRAAGGHQVRLNLAPADLLGQDWHALPPMLRAI